uniref:Fucosyltransferase n=2 Tax=Amorphochlora amoebiformis TaxID=1561963 RepID=A0A7S0GY69_9EUKA|mmetsp:Transcript_26274/g.41549  ORF Transcript_26274/g.41549 Transcript_26274/m.41549 type:complete len:318 (+) Transcript_26274:3-956(+)
MDTWKDGVYRPDDMMFVRHTKGRPLLIGLNTDPWRGEDCNHLDLIFDTKKQHSFYGCPSVYIPMALLNLLPSSYKPHHLLETTRTKSRALESLKEQDSDNRKFCVMFCHPCRPHPVSGDGVILWTFLSVLEQEYKACDVIGDCQKAVDIPTYCGIWEREKYVNASVELYRSYRFVMAFETTQVDGYFTESVALAAIAGAVPVFWGDEGIGDRINEKRLVNINAHVSEEHVLKLRDAESISGDERITFAYNFLHQDFLHAVKHIRSLDEDYAKYQIKLTNSIIKEKSVDMSVLSPKRIAHAFRNILTDLDSYVTKEEE